MCRPDPLSGKPPMYERSRHPTKGMDFARFLSHLDPVVKNRAAQQIESQQHFTSSESSMTLETIISVGVLGWLAMGMVLMGLGIW